MKKDDKILVGLECEFDRNTMKTTKTTPIYAPRTPELEAAEKKMYENFARSILPLIKRDLLRKDTK